jgi:hypothetical protein
MAFVKAERRQAKLRLALDGPSGSGKTYSALLLAKGMGGRIAVIDTERGSASLYSHLVDFDVCELEPPFKPQKYVDAIAEAEKAGYDIIIIDSLSHAWEGEGGILDMTELASKGCRGNKFAAWRETTPIHNKLVNALVESRSHIVVCLRTKTAWEVEKTDDGKSKPVKIGLKPAQREGIEYEFTIVLDLAIDGHIARASKDRTSMFDAEGPFLIKEELGVKLMAWLNSGGPALPQNRRQEAQAEAHKKADTASGPGKWLDKIRAAAMKRKMPREIWDGHCNELHINETKESWTGERLEQLETRVAAYKAPEPPAEKPAEASAPATSTSSAPGVDQRPKVEEENVNQDSEDPKYRKQALDVLRESAREVGAAANDEQLLYFARGQMLLLEPKYEVATLADLTIAHIQAMGEKIDKHFGARARQKALV